MRMANEEWNRRARTANVFRLARESDCAGFGICDSTVRPEEQRKGGGGVHRHIAATILRPICAQSQAVVLIRVWLTDTEILTVVSLATTVPP